MSYPHANPRYFQLIRAALTERNHPLTSLKLACGISAASPIEDQHAFSQALVTLIQMKIVWAARWWGVNGEGGGRVAFYKLRQRPDHRGWRR